MSVVDTQLYLKLTGLEGLIEVGHEPDLKLLKLLVKGQVTHVPYQNHDLQNTRTECDLSPGALLKRMLVDKRGGMCFEGSEFMLQVLKTFGFDARLVATFVMINQQVYTEGAILDHHIIVVHLQGKKYLVDTAFSYNSIREPLEFSFEQTEERVVIPNVEKYRLECAEDHYKLSLWLKGNFATMYRFQRPLTYMNDEQGLANYRRFLTAPAYVPIRDGIMKVGVLTETGRIGFTCSYDSKSRRGKPPYSMLVGENNQPAKSEKVTYEKYRDSIKEIVNLELNDEHFDKWAAIIDQ